MHHRPPGILPEVPTGHTSVGIRAQVQTDSAMIFYNKPNRRKPPFVIPAGPWFPAQLPPPGGHCPRTAPSGAACSGARARCASPVRPHGAP